MTPQATTISRDSVFRKVRSLGGRSVSYLLLIAWSIFTVFALGWIVLASVKTTQEVFREPLAIPDQLLLDNYERIWTVLGFSRAALNSLIVVSAAVLIILILSAPAAYVLSRFQFRGKEFLTGTFIAGIGLPVPIVFIPLFAMLTSISLINSLVGLAIVYVAVSVPFTVFLLTGFFAGLPIELTEAAVIDGATPWVVFRRVMLPLARPGLVTAATFNAIFLWNEFQLALVFVQTPERRPVALGLKAFQDSIQYSGDWPGLFAAVSIVVVPTVVAYIFLSERMMSGITMGAVK